MSFRQIFDRISRLARSELGSSGARSYEHELRRAQQLIDEARRREHGETDSVRDDGTGAARVPADDEYRAACATLGVQPGASWEAVTSAFRARARIVHPDRAATLTADEQRAAHRRMQELNAAYEILERRMRR